MSVTMSASLRSGATALVCGLTVALIACGGGAAASTRTVTAAELDALPRLSTTDGATLCASGTPADTVCPLQVALGNWLRPAQFAVWEVGRPVNVWQAGTRHIVLSSDTNPATHYVAATGVGSGESADEVNIVDAISGVEHRYRLDGTQVATKTLHPMNQLSMWGYYGSTPIQQVMETSADNLTADVVVKVGSELDDPKPREIFRANLPWFHLINGSVTKAPPLFPNAVVYAFGSNGEAVWSDGARFAVERDHANGKPIWKITSDVTGPAVDSADIAWKRHDLTEVHVASLEAWMIDSMTVSTEGTHHPAINGVLLSPGGDILVARSSLPKSDSVIYVRIAADGALRDQMVLPKTAQPVLFAGDSVLVHRTVDNEPKTLVWLRLSGGK